MFSSIVCATYCLLVIWLLAQVTDGTGRRLDFSHGCILEGMTHGIVAAPPAIHAAIIEAVQALKRAGGSERPSH